jgi:hypothetical protein
MNFMFINNSPTKVRQTKIKNTAPAMHEQKKIVLPGVDHIFVFTAIIFVLNSNMINVEFVMQDIIDGMHDIFCFTDSDILFQIDMTFEMNICVT